MSKGQPLTYTQRFAVETAVDLIMNAATSRVTQGTMVDMITAPILIHMCSTKRNIDRNSLEEVLKVHCMSVRMYADMIDMKLEEEGET
jgi:hypothetical protein